jgi:hypothetical protein
MREDSNDFHYQVADYLEAKGWNVERSPYYVDVIKQKSREIDIIAQKSTNVLNHRYRKKANLLIRLFIECKWILPSISIHLNFVPKDKILAEALARDNDILRGKDWPPLEDTSKEPPRVHHYLQENEVVKGWSCSGNDIFYEAWEQVLLAFLYYKHHLPKGRFLPIGSEYTPVSYTIDYQIVVVNSFNTFFRRDAITKTSTSSPISNNFLLLVNYSYQISSGDNLRNETMKNFFIDIVTDRCISSLT